MRTYTIDDWACEDAASNTRTVADIVVQRIAATIGVSTTGDLDLSNFGDVAGGLRVELSGIPERRYANKAALRIELPGATPDIVRTLALLISECLVSLFPQDWEYVAVLAECANSLPEGIMPRVQGQCPQNVIYIVEDSLTDIGLVSCIDRNIQRILELCWDYLDWHCEQLSGVVVAEPEWEVGSLPEFVPPEVHKGFFRRLAERVRKALGGKRKGDGDAQGAPEEAGKLSEEPHAADGAQAEAEHADSSGAVPFEAAAVAEEGSARVPEGNRPEGAAPDERSR